MSDVDTYCSVTVQVLILDILTREFMTQIETKQMVFWTQVRVTLLLDHCRYTTCRAQYAVNGRASFRAPTV